MCLIQTDKKDWCYSNSEKIIDEYADVFEGLGYFGKLRIIRIKYDTTPHVTRYRKITLAMNDSV